MIFTGVMTATCFIIIAAKFGPKFLKRMLGFEIPIDIGSHIFLIWLGALSGTFSGVVTGLISALCISLVLRGAKNILGYSTYTNGEWIEHEGIWTVRSVTSKLLNIIKYTFEHVGIAIKEGIQDMQNKPKALNHQVIH